MSATKPAILDFISGVSSRLPCCLVSGDTVALGAPRTGETCVRLGTAGTAAVIRLAAAVGARGFVYGVEMSKDVMKRTAQTVEKAGIAHAAFIHSIYEDTQLADAVADLVVSDCSIALSGEKHRVFEEISRILKPGGRFVVSDIFSDAAVVGINEASKRKSMCFAELTTKETYLDILDELGFERVTIIEESAPHPVSYFGKRITLQSFVVAGKRPRHSRQYV